MHFASLLQISLFGAAISATQIRFCNDYAYALLDTGCITEDIKFDECHEIPEYQYKGVKDSSCWIDPDLEQAGKTNEGVKCLVYEGKDCEVGQEAVAPFTGVVVFDEDVVYKSYKCWEV